MEMVEVAPEYPAEQAKCPDGTTTTQWEFNVQVTGTATRLSDLLVTAGSPYPGDAVVPAGVPMVRDAVFDTAYPSMGQPHGGGLGKYRPPRNVRFQVSPKVAVVVAMTKDNYTTPVATTGAEVGTLMTAGAVVHCPRAGQTHLRILANTNQAVYPVNAKTAFQFVSDTNPTSMTVVFSD